MAKHRRQEAEFLRGIRISMYPVKSMPLTEQEIQAFKSAFILLAKIVICTFMLVAGCTVASAEETIEGYTISQYVEAIYKAEGGEKAQYPYGIRSVNCEGKEDCRKVCYNTVKNNVKRWKASNKADIPFLEFLAGRYAPVGVRNDPTGLNRNWIKNCRYFLDKGGA